MRDVKILNAYGLHARPAALLVKTASRFDADLYIEKDGSRVSGKSIMGLMTLQASCGCTLRLTAEGRDAGVMLDEVQRLIEGKFDEE